jgi:serine/threonine protein kinase
MDELLVMYYAVEVLRLAESLHGAGVLHADLKPDNLLVRNGGHEWCDWAVGTTQSYSPPRHPPHFTQLNHTRHVIHHSLDISYYSPRRPPHCRHLNSRTTRHVIHHIVDTSIPLTTSSTHCRHFNATRHVTHHF